MQEMAEAQVQEEVMGRFARARQQAALAREDGRARRWAFWLAIVMVLVGWLDVVSTHLALEAGGEEANPIVHFLMVHLGAFWAVPKIVLHGLIGFMIMWWPNRPTLLMLSVTTAMILAAVINNFAIAAMI